MQLSVCAELYYTDLAFVGCVKKLNAAGFLAEFWGWADKDIDALAADPDLRWSSFVGGGAGAIFHPDGVKAFLDHVEKSLVVANKLRIRQLVLISGDLGPPGEGVRQPISSHPAT